MMLLTNTTETTTMAMRSVANLTIQLGLFGFPIKVYKATNDPSEGTGFRQVHAACSHPINQVKRCAHCEVDVPWGDLAKGVEVAPGEFITISDDDLKALKPEGDGTVKIDGYLAAGELDDAYLDGTVYFLSPTGPGKKIDTDTFTTFRDALNGRWAIGKVVMYGRERVVAIRALDRLLAMHFIRTHAEVRTVADVPGYANVPETAKAEYLALMAQVMDRSPIVIDDVVLESDAYADAVRALVAARVAGSPVAQAAAAAAPAATGGVDLMAMLRASLAQ
jgi:DNA end-binding protein Ku